MGVPAFFKWICMRCPKILHDVIDDDIPPEMLEDEEYLNRRDLEIDNFYLDMNGIIHPCTHPEHLPIPKPLNEEEMFNNIYKYLDKLMKMVKPRKLVYFAVDGVAPRAKMNQQRGRRFKAAQEALKIIEKKEQLKKEWKDRGQDYPEELEQDFNSKFDSNVITPGTEFMHRMSKAVQYYIVERMNKDPLFKDVKCIFSDANIPGEGEHKILDFVRQQRAMPGYDPNTKHCLYGADADLIMLGLSTHEPYFYILRETVMTKKELKGNQEEQQQQEGEFHEKAKKEIPIHFQFIKLYAFREYLDYEFKYLETPFEYDVEKVIDDFVFMCFFVGNDFLPHMPCLTIRDGGIDCLLYLYKRNLPLMGGYFVENGELNLMRVDLLLREVGQIEETLLANAAKEQENRKNRQQRGGRGGGRNDRGDRNNYNQRRDNDRGYDNRDNRGYGGRDDRSYNNRDNRGYNRDDRGYDRGYNRDDRGYNRDDRDYNRGGRDDRDYNRGGRDDRNYNRDDRDYNRGDRYDRGGDRVFDKGGYDQYNYNRSNSRGERDDRGGRGYRGDGDERDYNRGGRDDRGYNRDNRDNREREKDEQREAVRREDPETRNARNRSVADLFKAQLQAEITKDPNVEKNAEDANVKGSTESVMGKAKESPEKAAPKQQKVEKGVSLDDWGRDDEEETEEKLKASEQVQTSVASPSTAMQDTPAMKSPESIMKSPESTETAQEKYAPEPALVTMAGSDGEAEKKMEEEKDPRSKFNTELNEKIREDQKGDETFYDPRKSGFKETYYFEKFKVLPHEFPEFKKLIRKAYCEALCWVFAYYYKGCISWEWYYPFHYTPFAADIVGLDKVDVQFETGQPFRPMEQLMAVLPPYSARAVPACLRSLMTNDDSEIIDFYPKDFYVDVKGKRFAWMGEVILPFIDSDRLLRAVAKKIDGFTPSEVTRNRLSKSLVYVKNDSAVINALKEQFSNYEFLKENAVTDLEYGKAQLGGTYLGMPQKYQLNHDYHKPYPCEAVGEVTKNQVLTLTFENPPYKPHLSKLLQGAVLPDALYTEETFAQVDRRFFAGAKTIRLVERALGVVPETQGGGYKGYLNTGPTGIVTSYGMQYQANHLSNFNASFNNNRAVERMPTQFKRHSYQSNNYQPNNFQGRFEPIQPPPNMPPGGPGQLNSTNPMGYPPPMGQQMNTQRNPPMNPPMNQMGSMSGGFFNQQNYGQQQQQPPRGNAGYPQQNQQLQNASNPFNLLQKRDQPSGRNQDDEGYGDQTRKQRHN